MTVDESLKTLLEMCSANVARVHYEGKTDQFITFQLIMISDRFFADDGNECVEHHYRIDLYSKSNYMTTLAAIKTALKGADWYSVEIDAEVYETDTGYYHVPIEAKYMEVL